jgi:hypothetical membrane protein
MTYTLDRETSSGSRTVQVAALGGILGPILFAVLVVVGGLVYGGYSHASQKVSELGVAGAASATLQDLNFVMLGVCVLGFSWALARVFGQPYLGPALVGYFGLVVAVHGLGLRCDVGCQGQTTSGLLHNITGLSGFVAAILGMLVLARRWREDANWQSHARFTVRAASVALVGLVSFVITQATGTQAVAGLAQRVFVIALLTWIVITAWKLRRGLDARRATTARTT